MEILVVGSIAYDDVETPYGSMKDSPGGSALYFSAAASLFAPVNVVGVIGKDFDLAKLEMTNHHPVNFEGVYSEAGLTFRWGGRYHKDPNKRDTLYTHLNVFQNFRPNIPDHFRKSEIVFLANIDPELQLQVLNQIKKPQLVILDTMNFWITGKRAALEKVVRQSNVLILNDEETIQLTGEFNLISAAKKVLAMGPQVVIIKKGAHGSIMLSRDFYFIAPAYPVEQVIDPTGAGDSFAGGFVGNMAKAGEFTDSVFRQSIINGTAIASYVVEAFSFKGLINLTEKKLEQRLLKLKEITAY